MIDKILTVTYVGDIPNMLYQGRSLNKNWLGTKNWDIVIEDSEVTTNFIKEHVVSQMPDWNINLIERFNNSENSVFNANDGWRRQQSLKLEMTRNNDATLVLDGKNFLLFPIDETFFFVNGRQKIQAHANETDQTDPYYSWNSTCAFFCSSVISPRPFNITPWILRADLVENLLEEFKSRNIDPINEKFFVSEFESYFFVNHDKFDWEVCCFHEGYLAPGQYHENFQGIKYFSAKMNRLSPDVPWWVYHRHNFVYPKLTELSSNLLKTYGVVNNSDIELYNKLIAFLSTNYPNTLKLIEYDD